MQLAKTIAALGLALAVLVPASADTPIGESKIYGVKVTKNTDTEFLVEVDYYYSGEFGPSVGLGVIAKQKAKDDDYSYRPYSAKVGRHKQKVEVMRAPNTFEAYQTTSVDVQMWEGGKTPFLVTNIALVKNWPDFATARAAEVSGGKERPDSRLDSAIEIIDSVENLGDHRLELAKRYLDQVILQDPKNVRAYLELARVYMKSDTSMRGHENSDGVMQAERILNVALQMDPHHADTHVLLGYVYAAQSRTDEAIEALTKAERIGTKNMWLYYNWGLALQKAGKKDEAITKYQVAITKPIDRNDKSLKSHNRALPGIYYELIELLEEKEDWNEVDRVYKKKIFAFHDACDKAWYARFKLTKLGDYEDAIGYAKNAMTQGCGGITTQVLASAYLAKWNDKSQRIPKDERKKLFRQAQALYSDSPRMLYVLAQSPHTSGVIPGLIRTGVSVDTADSRGATPLAYAVGGRDSAAALALLRHGANPNLPINPDKWTVLMLAAATGNVSMVDLLLKHGADSTKKSKSGITAEAIARESGFVEIARKVSAKRGT